MKTPYGIQVDAWGALVMGQASLAKKVEIEVVRQLRERKIRGLKIFKGPVALDRAGEKRQHLIFRQDLGNGGEANVFLRIAGRQGKDLELSWRLIERNSWTEFLWGMSQSQLVFWGIMFMIAGFITIVAGIGFCMFPLGVFMLGAGLGWWKLSRNKTTASSYEQFDSRALAQTVDYVLMQALAKNGVSATDLRVLRRANMEGLGNLAATRPLENLIR